MVGEFDFFFNPEDPQDYLKKMGIQIQKEFKLLPE
jgi:hypothetical protein